MMIPAFTYLAIAISGRGVGNPLTPEIYLMTSPGQQAPVHCIYLMYVSLQETGMDCPASRAYFTYPA